MGRYIISFFLIIPFSATFADCGTSKTNLFSCTFDNGAKYVEVCMQETDKTPIVTYAFGRPNQKPELAFEADFRPAVDGDGYRIWYDEGQTGLNFQRGNHLYSVDPSGDTPDEEVGALFVEKDQNEMIYSNACDQGSLDWSFDPLWKELDAKGWFYIYDSQVTGWVNKGNIK